MGGKWAIADAAPAVNSPKYTTACQAGDFNPVEVCLNGAELAQRRSLVLAANVVNAEIQSGEWWNWIAGLGGPGLTRNLT